jgi:tight adherence protein C
MNGTAFILPTLAAITVFLIYTLAMHMTSRGESTSDRVRRMTSAPPQPQEEEKVNEVIDPLRQEADPSALAIVLDRLMNLVGINTEKFKKNVQLQFYQAGITSPNAPIYYLFFKRIGFVIFLAVAFFFASKGGTGMERIKHYLLALIFGYLGVMGPNMLIKNSRQKREKVLQRSFPDALDLLLVCVESGLALDGALSRVCKELGRAHPEITLELNRTRMELTLLNDRATALGNLAARTNMLCFRSLVTTLLQSEKFGTSLTDTLRVLSEDFRHTRLMLAEEKAGRLPVLMTIPLITLLIPALFLIILGPAVINVMSAFTSH